MSNGIDIVYINRFKDLINNEKFLSNNFTSNEIKYINNSLTTMAGIYAAKEAFLKAIKKGINSYPLNLIEIYHIDNAPYIKVRKEIKETFDKETSLSISHDKEYAIAIVTII